MATVVSPIVEPSAETIASHLGLLFAPCVHDYPGGLIEIAHTGGDGFFHAALFPISKDGLGEALVYAIEQNRRGQNLYVGVNPRKPHTPDNKRASDKDVEIAFWHFADLDKWEAVEARRWTALPPSLVVVTGTQPTTRPHLYWLLDEPTSNMPAWTEQQRSMALALGGDAVVNPSRIMRLAGTVNFPTFKKQEERQYAVELTTLQSDFGEERGPFSFGEIAAAYPKPVQVDTPGFDYIAEPQEAVQPKEGETTLSAMARGKADTLISQCKSGDGWHNAMIALVAHLAAIGTPSAVIMGLAPEITLPGYTVADTRREMGVALRGAYAKGYGAPPDEVAAAEQGRDRAEGTFTLLDMDELEALPPPAYIVEDLLTETGFCVLYGAPGSGKSFVALDVALRLAYQMDWHGKATRKTGVLYIAGEGHAGLGKRVKGWRREHALEGEDAPFLLLPVAVQMLEDGDVAKLLRTIDAAVKRAGFHIGLVVIDTVSRSLTGADENSQDAMSKFVHACSKVQAHVSGAVIGVHHTGKDESRGMRGSTVLIGACDTSIKCEGEGEGASKLVTLTVEKQKDGEEIAPLSLILKQVGWAAGLAKDITTLVPVSPNGTAAPPQPLRKTLTNEQRIAILEDCNRRFEARLPMTNSPKLAVDGLYLPRIVSRKYDLPFDDAKGLIQDWIESGILVAEVYEKRNGKRGLKAPNIPSDWLRGSRG